MDNIAGTHILLNSFDCCLEIRLGEVPCRDAYFARFCKTAVSEFLLCLELFTDAVNFFLGAVICGPRIATNVRIHTDPENLADMIKNENRLRDHVVKNRDLQRILFRLLHGWLHVVDIFVSHIADRAAGEGWHARSFDRLVLRHLRFDNLERVFWGRDGFGLPILVSNRHYIFKDPEDFARVGSEEGETADILATNDGLEQEGRTAGADLGVCAERRLAICSQVQIDGHGVAFGSKCFEFGSGWLELHEEWNVEHTTLNAQRRIFSLGGRAESGKMLLCTCQRFLNLITHDCEVAHLSTGSCFAFVVEM